MSEKKVLKTIWIDLENSPHVPFFSPIIDLLRKKGYTIALTARDCSQTCKLADLYRFNYKKIGKHYGKKKLMKVTGLLIRTLQLFLYMVRIKPYLAVSHGSRTQVVAAKLLRISSIVIMDYEFTSGFIKSDWFIIPDIIKKDNFHKGNKKIFTYPGIKEDVYVPFFKPDFSIIDEFNIPKDHLIVTIRPPAVEAHYHNPESEVLFREVVSFLASTNKCAMIILSRYEKQKQELKKNYFQLIEQRTMILPDKVYDGLNLIWYSDLVVSGGGTMNREAAALGVPVYSIFRGTIGAVDTYLSDTGKLVLLKSVDDVKTKIKLDKRDHTLKPKEIPENRTLNSIVDTIIKIGKR